MGAGGSALVTMLVSCRPMMTALKLCGDSLLVNARASAAASPRASRPRCRSLAVCAAKAAGPPTVRQPEFIEKLAQDAKISQKDAKAYLTATLDLIAEEVSFGNKVSFTG